MYCMKKIITHDEDIVLPKCMYNLKPIFKIDGFGNQNHDVAGADVNLNIDKQVIKFLQTPNGQMAELERRQDLLLKKLDILYDRIKTISSLCATSTAFKSSDKVVTAKLIDTPDDIVLVCSPDNLPWFILIVKKLIGEQINLAWHIHSSVAPEKVEKIKKFMKGIVTSKGSKSAVNIRLIFKNVAVNSELKLSSLHMPIVGNVNILRFIALAYPNEVPYQEDFLADSILDICHILERTSEKNKEAVIKQLFSQYDGWLCNKTFSIVDIAAFNVVKQWRSCPKSVPKEWIDKCEKLLK